MSYPGTQETTATPASPPPGGFEAAQTQATERLTVGHSAATQTMPEPSPPPSPPPAAPAGSQQAGDPNVTQPPAGAPSHDTFEFDLDGQREAISLRDAQEMVRWGIKTLARAREQATQTPREEHRAPQPQQQANDPQLLTRLDRLEASLRERDIRDQSDALYQEIDQSLNDSEVLKELAGDERRQATGLVAAVIAGDRNISVKSAAAKVESILGKLSQRSKNQYIQDKITQSATRPPSRGAPASTPTPKLVGKDLFNGKVESAALQRALRAQNS